MAKNTREVHYKVYRNTNMKGYYNVVHGTKVSLIKKTTQGWYAGTCYHRTLRDAIIYCLYGV